MTRGDTGDDVRALFVEYARTRDRALRDRLIETHLGLARYHASSFSGRGEPIEDLVQVANLGLLKAVERFDPSRGLEFSTFASPTITGEIKRHFRDHGWSIHVTRPVKELHLRLGPASAELTQQLGRRPQPAELAHHLGVSEDDVLVAADAGAAYRPASLDAPSRTGEADSGSLGDLLAQSASPDQLEQQIAVKDALDSLPPRERRIIYLRFFEDWTQLEIARDVGVSQMQVSRLIAKTLAGLREHLE